MHGGNRGVAPGFAVGAIGVSLLFVSILHVLYFHLPSMYRQTDRALLLFETFELAFLILPPAVLVYVAFRLGDGSHRAVPGEWSIVGWCALGAVSAPVLISLIKVHQYLNTSAIEPSLVQLELLTGAGSGGLIGLIVGLKHARAGREAERVREQQEAFVFLNRALRHHVLNSLNVVTGYARMARGRLPEGERDVLDPVVYRSESIVALIENVGRIAETYTGEMIGEPRDVVSLLADEVEAARLTFDHASIDASLPDRAIQVRGNDALRVAFEHVLTNAVEYNDRPVPSVMVSVETDPSAVTVRIADDGPGIAAAERERLFDPPDNGASGFGLYLAKEIVEFHGGSITIGANEPRGTTVEVTVPRMDDGAR